MRFVMVRTEYIKTNIFDKTRIPAILKDLFMVFYK